MQVESAGSTIPVRPELRIALGMASLQDDPLGDLSQSELNALDWTYLVDTCGRHKLIRPMIDLLPGLAEVAPTWVRRSLWARMRCNERAAEKQTEHLLRVCDLLEGEGIDYRVMRGPVLGILAHGDPLKREFSDLDIVVGGNDVETAKQLFDQHGFRTGESRYIVEQNCAYQLFNRELGVGVDLHWSAVPAWLPVGGGFDAMAAPPARVQIDGRTIPTFDRETTLLIQCVQCMKTAWVELERWRDFALLCAQWTDLDWERLWRTCREHGYLRSMALTLHLLGETARRSVPASELARFVPDRDLENAVRLIQARLPEEEEKDRFRGRSDEMMELSREFLPVWVYQVFRLSSTHYPIATWWLVTDETRQRRGYAWWIVRSHLSPKQADYDAARLPHALRGLYYLVRPLRLAVRNARAMLGKLMPAAKVG